MNIPYTILGTGSYLPDLVVDNEMFASILETSDEWITTRTGISRRHLCDGQTTWEMAVKAAVNAVEASQIDSKAIDMIIATTITPDYTTPNLACIIQAQIKAENAFCFDLNAACTGFVQAFDVAMHYLNTDRPMTVLIVSSESLSKLVDFSDRSTCVLFGDGAGAVILSNRLSDGVTPVTSNIYESFFAADGTGGEYMTGKAFEVAKHPFSSVENAGKPDIFGHETGIFLSMKGQDVYRFATAAVPTSIEKVMTGAGLSLEDIDYVIPHQANERIIQSAAKRLGLPAEKMLSNIAETGNTSSASIPICFDQAVRSGRIRRGQTLIFTGFGGGLTYGAVACKY